LPIRGVAAQHADNAIDATLDTTGKIVGLEARHVLEIMTDDWASVSVGACRRRRAHQALTEQRMYAISPKGSLIVATADMIPGNATIEPDSFVRRPNGELGIKCSRPVRPPALCA
jgi:hypothetical protein